MPTSSTNQQSSTMATRAKKSLRPYIIKAPERPKAHQTLVLASLMPLRAGRAPNQPSQSVKAINRTHNWDVRRKGHLRCTNHTKPTPKVDTNAETCDILAPWDAELSAISRQEQVSTTPPPSETPGSDCSVQNRNSVSEIAIETASLAHGTTLSADSPIFTPMRCDPWGNPVNCATPPSCCEWNVEDHNIQNMTPQSFSDFPTPRSDDSSFQYEDDLTLFTESVKTPTAHPRKAKQVRIRTNFGCKDPGSINTDTRIQTQYP